MEGSEEARIRWEGYVNGKIEELSRRVDATNELRGQLLDQAERYATKDSVEAVAARMALLERNDVEHASTQKGISTGWAYFVAGAAVFIAAVSALVAIYVAVRT